ncbi:antibiotic biosynthesis monooxygenase [Tsukamurella sp. NPDC003166]|uniref:putative quinol monooxygenase n=1 Tax=Tsukamurella sp. NPDC003166 TaxID=3154444 RepID=UPI0033A537D2
MTANTSRIGMIATIPAITDANREAFENTVTEAAEAVRAESGNTRYDWFFNAERTACVVHEEYADSDAVLTHLGTVGTIVGQLARLGGGLVVDLFGYPSPQLSTALEGHLRSAYMPHQPGT